MIVRRDPLPLGRVALVSGGGSGEESLPAGVSASIMVAGGVADRTATVQHAVYLWKLPTRPESRDGGDAQAEDCI